MGLLSLSNLAIFTKKAEFSGKYLSLKNDFKRLDSILNQGGASEARLCLKIQFRPTDV